MSKHLRVVSAVLFQFYLSFVVIIFQLGGQL